MNLSFEAVHLWRIKMRKTNPTVFAVVVTYNRLDLLKENLLALQKQSYPIHKIIVVNNHSTDGTGEYLKRIKEENAVFDIVALDKNSGGAGGFCEGIKRAVKLGGDWVWLMDDDTIPTHDALEKLIEKINVTNNVGFLGSRVLFSDGTPHLMNNTPPESNEVLNIEWNAFLEKNVLTVKYDSFVSCLINIDAVKNVGLPYRDFFIWNDDYEYTDRLVKAKYFGGLVLDSFVYHKTKKNYRADLLTANDSLAWKYFYGERNKVFIMKKENSRLKFLYHYIIGYHKVNKQLRKIPGNKELKKAVRKGWRKGFFFNPKIEYV